ncbi:MAG: hypothetical protein OXU61_10445 [Gammaproteobacteria bacterium]|nr:hypothetical protein [Gammaproteobacteria bacterium]
MPRFAVRPRAPLHCVAIALRGPAVIEAWAHYNSRSSFETRLQRG